MKKPVKYILISLAIIITGAVFYWNFNKKRIVKNTLENIVSGKTDSLYFIRYDSSAINASTGSARFYNVSLQSDSLQQQLLQDDSTSETNIYNIRIREINIEGADIPSLLSNDKVSAGSIRIIGPVVYIIETGSKKEKTFSYRDTLAIYEKILGKFNQIKADKIVIEDGQLYFMKKMAKPNIAFNGININLSSFLIDTSKNYDNLLSYFVKGVKASIEQAAITDSIDKSVLHLEKISYDATAKKIRIGSFKKEDASTGKMSIDIGETTLEQLDTDSFILNKQIKAGYLGSAGGSMTIWRTSDKKSSKNSIEFDNDFFDEAKVNRIDIGKTNIRIFDRANPANAPMMIQGVTFSANDIQRLYSGTRIRELVTNSNWNLGVDGFSFVSADKIYQWKVDRVSINKAASTMHIGSVSMQPTVSEAAFAASLPVQKDLFNIHLQDIDITGLNTGSLISGNMLDAKLVQLKPTLKIFNDRTVTASTKSKVGNYPHQLLQKMSMPVHIDKLVIKNGSVAYTERGAISEKKGTVFFNAINGSIVNVSNVKSLIAGKPLLVLNVNTLFMGVSQLQTKWTLPLNKTDGSFKITLYTGPFKVSALNPMIEPLGMATLRDGEINSLNANLYGDDLEVKGDLQLLYKNLKMDLLKMDSVEYKKKGITSFFANLVIQDENPRNGVTRKGTISLERDPTRSFFNLLWKGIFKAAKRTATGKDDGKEN
ncbi:MAG TPA: hypothetical protein PLC48_00495 [Ferruginibacter sp.]|nr:hypothetical protein [Ferruginibacter sp.]